MRSTPNDTVRLHLANIFYDLLEIVIFVCAAGSITAFPRSAVVAVAAVGAVEPNFKNVAVICEQFFDLPVISLDVAVAPVFRVVAIPRRKIRSELDSVFFAGIGKFFDNVAFTFFPRRFFNAVLGGFCRPGAPAVVVLGGVNHAGHAAVLEGFDDAVGVKF